MNYKELFHIALQLISSPASAWEEIRLQEDKQKVFTSFVYPMIGLCGLSVFIGTIFSKGWSEPQSFQEAMTKCCAVAVSLFGGYYLAAYLLNEVSMRMLGREDNRLLMQQFAGYAMVVPFMLQIIIGLMPEFSIVAILLQFYIAFIIWEACETLLQIAEKERLRFTIIAMALLIGCPAIIQFIFNKLTAVLN